VNRTPELPGAQPKLLTALEGTQKKMKTGNSFMIHSELFLEYLILECEGSKVFRNFGRRKRTTLCHLPEVLNPHSNRCDNRNPVVYFSLPDFNLVNAAL